MALADITQMALKASAGMIFSLASGHRIADDGTALIAGYQERNRAFGELSKIGSVEVSIVLDVGWLDFDDLPVLDVDVIEKIFIVRKRRSEEKSFPLGSMIEVDFL